MIVIKKIYKLIKSIRTINETKNYEIVDIPGQDYTMPISLNQISEDRVTIDRNMSKDDVFINGEYVGSFSHEETNSNEFLVGLLEGRKSKNKK